MALHTYNLTALSNAVKHALGKTPDSTTSSADIVNDALQAFCNLHEWSWKNASGTLSFTAAQSYVALPADFESLSTLQINSTGGWKMQPATMQQINDLRADTTAVQVYGIYCYAVNWTGQASVTASPIARLELWPTPSANASNILRYSYKRIIPKLSGGTDLPDIPPGCMFALKKFVRAFAKMDDDQDNADREMQQAMEQVKQLIKLDGVVQGNLGYWRGGVETGRPGHDRSIRPGESIVPAP